MPGLTMARLERLSCSCAVECHTASLGRDAHQVRDQEERGHGQDPVCQDRLIPQTNAISFPCSVFCVCFLSKKHQKTCGIFYTVCLYGKKSYHPV